MSFAVQLPEVGIGSMWGGFTAGPVALVSWDSDSDESSRSGTSTSDDEGDSSDSDSKRGRGSSRSEDDRAVSRRVNAVMRALQSANIEKKKGRARRQRSSRSKGADALSRTDPMMDALASLMRSGGHASQAQRLSVHMELAGTQVTPQLLAFVLLAAREAGAASQALKQGARAGSRSRHSGSSLPDGIAGQPAPDGSEAGIGRGGEGPADEGAPERGSKPLHGKANAEEQTRNDGGLDLGLEEAMANAIYGTRLQGAFPSVSEVFLQKPVQIALRISRAKTDSASSGGGGGTGALAPLSRSTPGNGHVSVDSTFSSGRGRGSAYPHPDRLSVQQVMRGGGQPDDSLLYVSWGDIEGGTRGERAGGASRLGPSMSAQQGSMVSASLLLPKPADAHIEIRLGRPQQLFPDDEDDEQEAAQGQGLSPRHLVTSGSDVLGRAALKQAAARSIAGRLMVTADAVVSKVVLSVQRMTPGVADVMVRSQPVAQARLSGMRLGVTRGPSGLEDALVLEDEEALGRLRLLSGDVGVRVAGRMGADGVLIGVSRDNIAPVLRLVLGWSRSIGVAAGAASQAGGWEQQDGQQSGKGGDDHSSENWQAAGATSAHTAAGAADSAGGTGIGAGTGAGQQMVPVGSPFQHHGGRRALAHGAAGAVHSFSPGAHLLRAASRALMGGTSAVDVTAGHVPPGSPRRVSPQSDHHGGLMSSRLSRAQSSGGGSRGEAGPGRPLASTRSGTGDNNVFSFDDPAAFGAQEVDDLDSLASSTLEEGDEWAELLPALQVVEHRSWSVELGQCVALQTAGPVHEELMALESPDMADVRARAAAEQSSGIRTSGARATLSSLNSSSQGIVRLIGPARLDATLAAASATVSGAAFSGALQLLPPSAQGPTAGFSGDAVVPESVALALSWEADPSVPQMLRQGSCAAALHRFVLAVPHIQGTVRRQRSESQRFGARLQGAEHPPVSLDVEGLECSAQEGVRLLRPSDRAKAAAEGRDDSEHEGEKESDDALWGWRPSDAGRVCDAFPWARPLQGPLALGQDGADQAGLDDMLRQPVLPVALRVEGDVSRVKGRVEQILSPQDVLGDTFTLWNRAQQEANEHVSADVEAVRRSGQERLAQFLRKHEACMSRRSKELGGRGVGTGGKPGAGTSARSRDGQRGRHGAADPRDRGDSGGNATGDPGQFGTDPSWDGPHSGGRDDGARDGAGWDRYPATDPQGRGLSVEDRGRGLGAGFPVDAPGAMVPRGMGPGHDARFGYDRGAGMPS